jgi:hypothetical protein
LGVVVDGVLVLASHGVVHKVETRLTRNLDGRLLMLGALLTVGVNLGHLLLELVKVQALHLSSVGSSSNGGKLLLKLLLALSEEETGKLKLFHDARIHLGLLAVEGRRSQDLLWHRVHMLLLLLLLLLLALLLLLLLVVLLTTTVLVATEAGGSS